MIVFYSDKHLLHNTDIFNSPGVERQYDEVPARVETIRRAVERAGLGEIVAPTDHGLDPILAVHDPGLIEFLQTVHRRFSDFHGQPRPVMADTFDQRRTGPRPTGLFPQIGYYNFDTAGPILEGTWEAAYWAAQCAVDAAAQLTSQALLLARERRISYALCRPPGHHAGRDYIGGYCYLNNAAIAARALQSPPHPQPLSPGPMGVTVAILDFDNHHGNGTQSIFYEDPSVLFVSLHAEPNDEYPYFWGHANERGLGAGEGFNVNLPLPLGTGDDVFLVALGRALEAVEKFAPDYMVVSAGFDVLNSDRRFMLTTDGIAKIGAAISKVAVPTVVIQEGGYLQETLGENAVRFLRAFK